MCFLIPGFVCVCFPFLVCLLEEEERVRGEREREKMIPVTLFVCLLVATLHGASSECHLCAARQLLWHYYSAGECVCVCVKEREDILNINRERMLPLRCAAASLASLLSRCVCFCVYPCDVCEW